jgi:two-component system, chemotaxis family, protein-glutamate methylesterase/glutaminase
MAEGSLMDSYKVLVIGGSAGSLDVMLHVLPDLRRDLSLSIVVVLHRKSFQDSTLVDLFSAKTGLNVKEADEKEPLLPGTIYIAPADYHLLIENDRTFSLDYSEKINYSRPSIDVTFESVADIYGTESVALLLSGANADGVDGLKAIRDAGGLVLVQNPTTADVAYMPQHAIDELEVSQIINPTAMAGFINNL